MGTHQSHEQLPGHVKWCTLHRKQKEDDALALQKYARADDVKLKELNLHIEKLSRGVCLGVWVLWVSRGV